MKKLFFLIFSALLFIFSAADIFAADFLFTAPSAEVKIGDEFQVFFSADAKQSDINAVAGKIFFPDQIAELVSINTGVSDINFWVEQPASAKPGDINFSGIIPNGFRGKISLFSAIFRAKTTGEFILNYDSLEALKNDGAGTAEETKSEKLAINILAGTDDQKSEKIILIDSEPPENFEAQIIRTKNLEKEKYFLTFHTEDKQSGMDHYEILEQKTFNFFNFKYSTGHWNVATSPYELSDQKLTSDIYIKAFDRAGNVRTVFLTASSPAKWYENRLNWSIIILLAAIILACLLFYANKHKKNSK